METINILSIDFDFFQKVEADIIHKYYPDGIDLSPALSTSVWEHHNALAIAKGDDLREKVKLDRERLKELKEVINNNSENLFRGMICDSHVHAYNFVHSVIDSKEAIRVNIVNIDLHHDVFNDNKKLDCGNWYGKLIEDMEAKRIPHQAHWITQPTSLEIYDLQENEFPVETDFERIKETKWDAVYLCRSCNWLPPHLDKDFSDFAEFLRGEIKIAIEEETEATVPRKINQAKIEKEAKSFKKALDRANHEGATRKHKISQ